MKLYLAGPDVFLPDAREIAAAKKALCADAGHSGLFPLDAKLPPFAPTPEFAEAIFASNLVLIQSADAVLANLTPFRGPSADSGTVWEVGYAHALGKKVFGYSNVGASFAARTHAFVGGGDGMEVEDFGLASDNLMIHFTLAGYFAYDAADVWRDLTSFKAALKAAG
jgi:nucleoside 2-deoxyribosyltransferase